MSLDRLVQKTIRSHTVQGVELYLPPEYEISSEDWKILFNNYNQGVRETKVASTIRQYVNGLDSENRNAKKFYSISEVVEIDSRFYVDLTFEPNKPGLTMLYIFNVENLKLVPICPNKDNIECVCLTYVPE